jgi:hypothetical protein
LIGAGALDWLDVMRSMWIICLSLMIPGASYGQQIQYLNYGDWVGVSAQERAYYIAGMIDGYLATDIGDQGKTAAHYSQCGERRGMKSNQLADGVMSFAQERPDLHAKPLLGALLQYLASVCGYPPR